MATPAREIQMFLKFNRKVAVVSVRLDETALAMSDWYEVKVRRGQMEPEPLAKRLQDAMEYVLDGQVELTREVP